MPHTPITIPCKVFFHHLTDCKTFVAKSMKSRTIHYRDDDDDDDANVPIGEKFMHDF